MVKGTNENVLIKANELVKNENVLVKMFNQHYINLTNSSGKAPNCLGNPLNPDLDTTTVLEIIKRYANHPSIVKIKNSFSDVGLFGFPEPLTENINAILKSLNPNKAIGPILFLS